MFNVFVNDGTQEMPQDDVLYIVCKEGVYLKKNLGIMESITPVENISILKSVEMMAQMHIKPIPAYQFAQVESFFREVYREHRSEAIVLLFYNEERKVYQIVPPHQKVSGASVDYNRAITIEGFTMIGDIHSHANMSAFHSSTDDKDEKSFDGLHITIGNCGSDNVSLSASIVSNGQRFLVEPSDYVNKLALTRDIDEEIEKPYSQVFIWDPKLKKMVPKPGKTRTYTVRRFDKRYVVDVSNKYRKFNPKWMDLVEHTPYTYYGYGAGRNDWRNRGKNLNWWSGAFDPNAWKDWKAQQNNKNTTAQQRGKPPTLPAKTTTPIAFPPHHQSADGAHEEVIEKKDFNPCEDCAFKEHKVDWLMEQLTGDEDDFPNEYDVYTCEKCEGTFSTSDPAAVCPTCKVDDYLVLEDEDDDISDIDWFRCDKCNIVFDTVENFPTCPECKSDSDLVQLEVAELNSDDGSAMDEKVYKYKCPHCASETDKLNDGNECPFCNQVIEDPIEQAGNAAEAMNNLASAIAADEELERLPIPDQNHTPINRTQKKSKRGIFRSLFRKGESDAD